MRCLPQTVPDPNLLVGLDTSDDAGVYRLTDDLALVQTVDFFTPIVDDPYMFGQIAAANALSDVYAMGAKPLTVLNIVGFPINKLDKQILADILRGASDKVQEAGATLVGGHSIDDQEPKFGMAVTGIVHPNDVVSNAGAKPGDKIVLTKPIGIGIQTTAIKRDLLTEEEIARVSHVMAQLNKEAADVMRSYQIHACTDVTGFGLLGHLQEMAIGSQVGIHVRYADVPVLPRTRELVKAKSVPGGSKENAKWLAHNVSYADAIDDAAQLILSDAVTSGGLLVAIAAEEAEQFVVELRSRNVEAAIIGDVTAANKNDVGKICVS